MTFFVLFLWFFFYDNQYSNNNNNKNVKNPSQSFPVFLLLLVICWCSWMADTYISGTLELFNYVRRNSASHSISCLQLLLLICLRDAPSLLLARHHLSCGGSPSCCRVCLVLIWSWTKVLRNYSISLVFIPKCFLWRKTWILPLIFLFCYINLFSF